MFICKGKSRVITTSAWQNYLEPEAVLPAIERLGRPLLCLAGSGRHVVLALAGAEVDYASIASLTLKPATGDQSPSAFATGYVGILSYDGFSPFAVQIEPHRIFRVTRSLVWDRQRQTMSIHADEIAATELHEIWVSEEELNRVFQACALAAAQKSQEGMPPVVISEAAAEDEYTQMVADAIERIRAGDFYQINLLRYFSLKTATFSGLLRTALNGGGSHASAFRCAGLELVSLSPEQFVTAGHFPEHCGSRSYNLLTKPIKGTTSRGNDATEDLAAKRELERSPKERAELAMIIDLLRNDLHRVCLPHSVDVLSNGHVEALPYVFHRVGIVGGKLRPQTELGEFFAKLMPGGSITGAPKRAAMAAIRDYEKRERGYFMGTAFCFDPRGYFDSAILIRTAYRTDMANDYAFAAGSGIVLMSDPAQEARECELKCRALAHDNSSSRNDRRSQGELGDGISYQ